MPAGAKLLGAEELIAKFQELSEKTATEYISASLEAGTEVIFDAIELSAPERKGTLKDNISVVKVEESRSRTVWGIFINADAFYWRFLQYGTKFISPRQFISKALKNRRSTARQTIRDTFRDLMLGFTKD